MSQSNPVDQSQRDQALDPCSSFIVQAPAGSGKTELLTRRYLRILSLVREPEEILAITFTRKAAAEMRSRIMNSLFMAWSGSGGGDSRHAQTRGLALKALDRDRKLGWNILNNPARLQIRTIDSFCLYLTGRMPVLSSLGGEAKIMDDPDDLYREAARNTLLELKRESPWHEPLSLVLLHLDNDWDRAGRLFMDMLRLREHWLRLVAPVSGDRDLKILLEGHLRREVDRRLKRAQAFFQDCLSREDQEVLMECADYAAFNLAGHRPDSGIAALGGMERLPEARVRDLDRWLGIRDLLLTREGAWRKRIDKNIGFPAASSLKDKEAKDLATRQKARFKDLLDSLSSCPALEESLAQLYDLPDTTYAHDTWQVLSALLKVLKMAVAQLELVMQDQCRVDYPQISMAALHALGGPEDPSDLLMRLDCRISHILFDEFQDTSISQQEMLSRLVSGWTPGDGRTLFVVGDPMQSIYGFRDADVGVFIKTRQEGMTGLDLKPLNLSVNFRSRPEVVEWINSVFPAVFQSSEDYVSGSVRYSTMSAARESSGLVRVHPMVEPGPMDEAVKVLEIIRQTRAEHPRESMAVLVRSRSHLTGIVKLLRRENISFQAVEIEPLKDRQVVMDLLSLTKAVINPGDRLAWLSILRAPWAGLDLKDLSRLSSPNDREIILEKLLRIPDIQGLSREGGVILQKLGRILVPAWENRQRRPLSALVRAVWISLGGHACCRDRQEYEDACSFLEFLEKYEQHQTIEDIRDFEAKLQNLYSEPAPDAGGLLQIMTIHKAKGLEFDTVILPGLEKVPRSPSRLLLQFAEVPAETGQGAGSRLLLAPMASKGQESHPTYLFIEKLKKTKQDHENGRLIYVACTRAKKRLHLLASARLNSADSPGPELKKPAGNSLLSPLWEGLKPEFDRAVSGPKAQDGVSLDSARPAGNILTRLSPGWTLTGIKGYGFEIPGETPVHGLKDEPVTYHWAGDAIRHVGTVVHGLLAQIADQGLDKWDVPRVEDMRELIRKDLARLGTSRQDLDQALAQVIRAAANTLSHDKGRWILAPHHQAKNEYSLSAVLDGEVIRMITDRTFIDEKGTRWIVDYKTSLHLGGGLEDFLDREAERYRGQILKYMRVFRMMDRRTVRAGLYFPLMGAWREIRG